MSSQPTHRSYMAPTIAVIGAVLFWGGSFTATRVALRSLHPMSIIWLRVVVALIAIAPFAGGLIRKTRRSYREGDWKLLTLAVLFQPCLYFLFETNALRLTTASQAGVISATVPLLVAVGAWMALKERITIGVLVGLLISVGGVIVLTLGGRPTEDAANPLLGNTLEFLAMVSAATNMVVIKHLSRRYDPIALTGMQFVAGTLFFLPGLVLLDPAGTFWSAPLVISVLFLGLFVSLGAFGLYNWGISRMPAIRASAFINLLPVVAVAVGWSFLGEGLSALQVAAAAVVIAGVVLSQARRQRAGRRT